MISKQLKCCMHLEQRLRTNVFKRAMQSCTQQVSQFHMFLVAIIIIYHHYLS